MRPQSQISESFFNQLFEISSDRMSRMGYLAKYAEKTTKQILVQRIKNLEFEKQQQQFRIEKQTTIIKLIAEHKLSKRIKIQLTNFNFRIIELLAPYMNLKIQKHYLNITKLHQEFYRTAKRQEYCNQVLALKTNFELFDIELYRHIIFLLLEYMREIFAKKLLATEQIIRNYLNQIDTIADKFKVKMEKFQKAYPNKKSLPVMIIQDKLRYKLPKLESNIQPLPFDNQIYRINRLKSENIQQQDINVQGRKISEVILKQVPPFIAKFKKHTSNYIAASNEDSEYIDQKKNPNISTIANTTEQIHERKEQTTNTSRMEKIHTEINLIRKNVRLSHCFNEYAQIFNQNINCYEQRTGISDLDKDQHYHRPRKEEGERRKWLITNISKLVQYFLIRNLLISKHRSKYELQYANLSRSESHLYF